MRRLFALLLAAGLGAWLAGPALSSGPLVPRATEFDQPIAARDGAARPDGGWRSAVVRAPKRFDLVGLSWSGARDVRARIRVRYTGSGAWSAWTPMAGDHGGGRGAEPVWAGGADALQVRLSARPRGLRANFVNSTGTSTAPQRALTALRRAVHGAYVALTGEPARAQGAGGAPPIIPRAAWGAEQCGAPRAAPSYGTVQTGFVHHTVNANDYTAQDSAAIMLAICRYHRNTKGWRDIGYNFLVDRHGQVFEGRAGGIDQAVIGAQAEGYNGVSTGVANIGTFGAVAQTPQAVQATARLLAWKLTVHGIPVQGRVTVRSGGGSSNRHPAGTPVTFERISGHRDADNTSCPGDALFAQLPEIRRRAAGLAPDLPAPAAPAATLTLGVSDPTLDYPQTAQVSGRAADNGGVALAGVPVSVQIASGRGFQTLVRAVSGADGTWSAQLVTQYTRRLRAVARLPGGALVASPSLAVAVAPRIGMQAPKRAIARRRFTVRGSIRPQRTSLVLVIAREGSDGDFHTFARVPVRARGGRFSVKVALRRPALHRLRMTSRADTRNRAGRSRDVYLRAVRPRR